MAIGIIFGILAGLLSGSAFLVLIQAANGAKIATPAAILTILAQLVMVPGIWIGVPMAAAGPLHLSSVDAMVGPYMAALASSFAAIVIVPLLAWIRGMARSWVVSAPAEAPKP